MDESSEKLLTMRLELLSSSSAFLKVDLEVKEVEAGGELEVGEATAELISS